MVIAEGERTSAASGSQSRPVLVDQGTQTESGPLAGEHPLAQVGIPEPDWNRLVELFTASELNDFELGSFAHFAREIKSAGELTATGRIARAARAGWCARQVLSSDTRTEYVSASPPCTLANRIYICLRCTQYPNGFISSSFGSYREACFDLGRNRPQDGSVSHAFASKTEAVVYVQAAGRPWPREL